MDELPALPANFDDLDGFRYGGSEYRGRPGSIELQEMGARSAPWAGSVQGSSVAPSAADPAIEMANLSAGDRYIRGMDPIASATSTEYAPSAPGEFSPGSIELQELGSVAPSIEPASPWEMSGSKKTAGYEIADLEGSNTGNQYGRF